MANRITGSTWEGKTYVNSIGLQYFITLPSAPCTETTIWRSSPAVNQRNAHSP